MRRLDFAEALEKEGRFRGLELAETIAFAFRRRYGLPPTDSRYLDATEEEMALDYWAHRHWDDPKLRDEAVNPDFDDDFAALEAASAEQPARAGVGAQPPPAGDEVIDSMSFEEP